jgi:Ser/Thr protein kinase RdoA (MazF antagonist)
VGDEEKVVLRLLRQKYGWQKRGLDAFNSLMRKLARRPHARAVYIEIVDAPG